MERICSNCGAQVGYIDKIGSLDNIMNDALSGYTKEQKLLIERCTLGMEYTYVLSLLLDLEGLSKKS